jgi:alpha-L-fucosidase
MGYLPIEFFDKVEYAQFLHDGSEIFLKAPPKRHNQGGEQKGFLGGLALPMVKPDVAVPVIEIFLKK